MRNRIRPGGPFLKRTLLPDSGIPLPTIVSTVNLVSERRTDWTQSQSKAAAALLVITPITPAYNPATDVLRINKQSVVFGTQETFQQAQKSYLWPPYVAGVDVQRTYKQAYAWGVPEVFGKPQNAYPFTVFSPYQPSIDPTLLRQQAKIFSEAERFIQPRATYVWPPYDSTRERVTVRGQALVFGLPETFYQPLQSFLVTSLTSYAAYDPSVEPRRAQDKTFSGPESFPQPAPQSLITVLTPYVPYDPTTDARRALQALVFGPVEVFPQAAPFSQVILNGSAAPPEPPVVVIVPPDTGSVPGFVPGAKKKRKRRSTGPTMREDQVFGETYSVSPFATSTLNAEAQEAQTRKSRSRRAAIAALMKELL